MDQIRGTSRGRMFEPMRYAGSQRYHLLQESESIRIEPRGPLALFQTCWAPRGTYKETSAVPSTLFYANFEPVHEKTWMEIQHTHTHKERMFCTQLRWKSEDDIVAHRGCFSKFSHRRTVLHQESGTFDQVWRLFCVLSETISVKATCF